MPAHSRWVRVCAETDAAPGSTRVFKGDGQQLVVIRTGDKKFFAVDNRCPHEGYPLAQGDLNGCILTCAWHNWRFDVTSGHCVLGGEGVRTYPVRIVDGAVEVDLAEPAPETTIPARRQSIEKALWDHDNGRAFRDATRLLMAGYEPWHLLADIARYDALHAEYGTTHVLPLAADCGRLLARYKGLDALYPVAQVIDLCGDSNRRLPERARAEPIRGASESGLRSAIESEDAARAEALVRGAFLDGHSRAVETWLFGAFSSHFTDFGHSLIYLIKAHELLAHVPDDYFVSNRPAGPRPAGANEMGSPTGTEGAPHLYAPDIYAGLVLQNVTSTREDTLPYMRSYFAALKDEDLPAVYARARPGTPFDPIRVRDVVLEGSPREAFDAVWAPLCEGVPARDVACALVGAAAHRLFRFDLEVEQSADVAEDWLWATHRLTFASAVRNATERFCYPDVLRFLVQAVAFINSGRDMDAPTSRRRAFSPAHSRASSGPDVSAAIVDAVVHRAPESAVALTRAALEDASQVAHLQSALEDVCLRDPLVRPILIAHALKTTVAAFEEFHALGPAHPDRTVPVLAAVRFLSSPVAERRVHQAVRTSIRWVAEGIMPRKLTQ